MQSRKGSAASIFKTEKRYKSHAEKSQTKSMNVCHSDKWHHYRKKQQVKTLVLLSWGSTAVSYSGYKELPYGWSGAASAGMQELVARAGMWPN